MNLDHFKRILNRYIKIYNLNELKFENGKLYIKLIYNISKEKLSKPVYRNFECAKKISDPDLHTLEENLSVVFKYNRSKRVEDPLKIIKMLDIKSSLKTEHEKALDEIREKIFNGEDVSKENVLLVLSNDTISHKCRKGVVIKYKLKIGKQTFNITNLKLHSIECVESDEELSYEELFEKIKAADEMMEKISKIKSMSPDMDFDRVITKEMLEKMPSEREEHLENNKLFKSYHHYLTNDLNRKKSSETIKYKGSSYEIVSIKGDGFIIIRQPEKRIVTDDKLIDKIVIKYKMLNGEIN